MDLSTQTIVLVSVLTIAGAVLGGAVAHWKRGSRHIATGAIIGFPDDDCWYDADVLSRVQQFLARHPRVDGVTGRALFDVMEHPPARFARRAQWVVPAKVWTQGISCTIFLRRALIARDVSWWCSVVAAIATSENAR